MKLFELKQIIDEELLLEKLGNLNSLKLGKLVKVFHQQIHHLRNGPKSSPIGKKLYHFSGISSTSEIIDAGEIKSFADIKKLYKKHETTKSFVLYVKDKAIAVGIFSDYEIAGPSRSGLLAWDLEPFKDKIETAKTAEKDLARSEWAKSDIDNKYKEKLSSASTGKESWEKVEKEYAGKAVQTGYLKAFIEELKTLADNEKITCKLVLNDKTANDKRMDRSRNRPSQFELESALRDLNVRLQKYKLSKKPTASNVEEFIKYTLEGKIKVVQLSGRAFKTSADDSSLTKVNPSSLLKGTPFSVSYSSAEPFSYDSLYIYYSYDPEEGTLAPFKATWSGKDEDGKLVERIATLEHKRYLKHEFGIKGEDKESVIKGILTLVKDSKFDKAENAISSLRKSGHDYPEFKVIEKSIAAEKAKK
jgi:hypothetical protein